jgi:tRNA U34 5-carboxymethylaminomethyl modifying GTPase MnmE/TrmE
MRATADEIEAAGVERAARVAAESDGAILVLDAADDAVRHGAAFVDAYAGPTPSCVVLNKCDLVPADALSGVEAGIADQLPGVRCVSVSALEHRGLDRLQAALVEAAGRTEAQLLHSALFTERQRSAIETALGAESLDALRRTLAACFGR